MTTPPMGTTQDSELSALLERVGGKKAAAGAAAPQFVIANRFMHKRAQNRAAIRKMVKPENARCVREHLPAPEDRTHCVLGGNFVLGDMIQHVMEGEHCPHMRLATLSLSVANAVNLANLVERGAVDRMTLIVSHYFAQVNRDAVFLDIKAKLAGLCQLVVTRSHAKIQLIPLDSGPFYVMEGSANLRSSDTLEHVVVFNDRELHDWHAQWIDELAARPEHQ